MQSRLTIYFSFIFVQLNRVAKLAKIIIPRCIIIIWGFEQLQKESWNIKYWTNKITTKMESIWIYFEMQARGLYDLIQSSAWRPIFWVYRMEKTVGLGRDRAERSDDY